MATPENDPAIALAGMARVGNPREPMGNAAYSVYDRATYAPSPNTTLVERQGDQAGDPTPPTAVRGASMYPLPAGTGDRNGAVFRVGAQFPAGTIPQAGQTQANGRIIRTVMDRNNPNFVDGAAPSYL